MKLQHEDVIKLLYEERRVRRYTQDSPVLPDVWLAFAQNPEESLDLLITPHQSATRSLTPGTLVGYLKKRLAAERRTKRWKEFRRESDKPTNLAYNLTNVAVRLWFDELVRIVLPLSRWWAVRIRARGRQELLEELSRKQTRNAIARQLAGIRATPSAQLAPDILWTIRVVGTIALVKQAREKVRRARSQTRKDAAWEAAWPPPPADGLHQEQRIKYFNRVVEALADVYKDLHPRDVDAMVHLVNTNRQATTAIWRSTVAVKADAATRVFDLSCRDISWAVIDSGIDAQHPAFRRRDGDAPVQSPATASWGERTRVIATYDFTIVREILSDDSPRTSQLPRSLRRKLRANPGLRTQLRRSLNSGREIDWSLLTPLIQVPHDESYEPPINEHGTHVAGILAADWRHGDGPAPPTLPGENVRGMCPDINLYDLRVLDENGEGDEFNVMAAMQFVRHLNGNADFMVLHGANLSLAIRHKVANYACGRTPVCEECQRLVGDGIVVVAAAGNEGYVAESPVNPQEGYRSISITDPGNAECVITVGATYRDAPHTYGVSYFSSRGPTADGRAKPDLVAPGEKVESCVLDDGVNVNDGTSMAAPHVSGAAAMLMARHTELIRQPARIKQIICDTATDLGREGYFQGRGMLDVLRALQSI